ncbi:MAG: Ig-like domain-containing protein, partial [bacterium]|nr:Ig-like domain-containing protein [bacterium]
TSLGQGSVSFTARQSLGGDTSEELAALSVILDRTAPSQIAAGVVPTSVVVGDAVSIDLTVPGEGQGLVYALTAAPAGMTINASTGEIAWTPTTGQLGTQSVGISITDIAGNTTAQDFSIQVTEEPWVELGINVVDANGQPLSTIGVGDTFVVQVTVQDLRGFQATGLFGAYMDLLYNESVIQLTSEPISRPEPYTNGPKGGTTTAGLVDELGAFSSSNSPLGAGLRVLAELEFTAIAVGDAGLMLDPADDAGNDVLLYGINEAISVNRVRYGTSSFAVGLDFELNDDVFNFDEDSSQQTLNVLDNDVISGNSNLTIVGVTTPASGAQVAISSDGKSILYTPAANFTGADVLEYTVQNQNSIQGVATVTIQLADVNDPPQALNDSFTVTENSSNNVLDVLANDNSGDDDPNSETLRILNVVAGSIAGTVSVRADQTLSYTPPADFIGSETFSYTLSDGRGATSVATVTVNVDVANPPPVAQDDNFSLTEDDGQASFDVLANDSTDDATETLSVSAVGTSSNGSVVQVAADGQSILYRPAANFNGTEVITYTLRDSGGATATANATFTVAAVNDAPTAVDDSASAISRNTTTSLDVLANDQDVDGDDLEIIAVTQPAAGNGSVAIAADGKSLIYTPPAVDFEGMVSLTYTVSDGNGESDTASVQIDVRDFIPRDIAGDIYYATFDLSSSLLSNLNVTLEGTDFTGNSLSRQAAVQGGRFQFSDVAPGEYTLIREPLPFLNDSGERIAISAAMEDGDLEQALRVTGSLRPQFFGIRDFLGSTFGHNLLVALNGDGTPAWTLGKGAWTELNSIDVQVDENEVLKIAAVNGSSQNVSASLPLNDNATRAYRVGEQTPYRLLRLRGTPEDVGVEPPASSSASTGEGEGQLSSNQPSSSSASLIGEGEAAPLPTPVPSGLAGSGQVNELPRPSIQAVRSTSLGQGGEAQSQSSRLSLRRSTLASGNSLTLSEAAVDEAMKSVLPKLEIGLSAGLESDLTGDNQSEQEAHDQALQSV